ncbi:hypothetical protein JCM8097_002887 [Rhodosporidiobolus ruineniae]
MPALINTPISAEIGFGVPASELPAEKVAQYLERFDADDQVPTRLTRIPLYNLRAELDAGALASPLEQLDERGYAAVKHESAHVGVDKLATVEGTNAYTAEAAELFKNVLGASKVIVWNSVVRMAGGKKDIAQTIQKKVEENKPPADNVKATAGAAHVDQDDSYARTIIKRAAGDDAFERYTRCQIVNLWRPLRGPVTNKPLVVSDFRTMDVEKDILRMAGSYGSAYSVSYSPNQRWSYISHQQPNEAFFLRCYDSNMGANGEALYTGHVAAEEVYDEPVLPELVGKLIEPRMSVEVRLVVLHE